MYMSDPNLNTPYNQWTPKKSIRFHEQHFKNNNWSREFLSSQSSSPEPNLSSKTLNYDLDRSSSNHNYYENMNHELNVNSVVGRLMSEDMISRGYALFRGGISGVANREVPQSLVNEGSLYVEEKRDEEDPVVEEKIVAIARDESDRMLMMPVELEMPDIVENEPQSGKQIVVNIGAYDEDIDESDYVMPLEDYQRIMQDTNGYEIDEKEEEDEDEEVEEEQDQEQELKVDENESEEFERIMAMPGHMFNDLEWEPDEDEDDDTEEVNTDNDELEPREIVESESETESESEATERYHSNVLKPRKHAKDKPLPKINDSERRHGWNDNSYRRRELRAPRRYRRPRRPSWYGDSLTYEEELYDVDRDCVLLDYYEHKSSTPRQVFYKFACPGLTQTVPEGCHFRGLPDPRDYRVKAKSTIVQHWESFYEYRLSDCVCYFLVFRSKNAANQCAKKAINNRNKWVMKHYNWGELKYRILDYF